MEEQEQGGLLPSEPPPSIMAGAPADDVASPREEGEEEVAYVMRVNGALRRRLGEKEAEIAALLERLAALLEEKEKGGFSDLAAMINHENNPQQSQLQQPQPPPQAHIGDYHAIGSRSLPLLSAAHLSRLNTMQQHGSSAPSPRASLGSNGNGNGNGATNPPEPPPHPTDNTASSIRRRYMALEQGEGAKPDLFLGSVLGPDAFFQSNLGLQFDEDSPAFRRRLQAMDENVDGMRSHLQRLVGIVQRYIETGQAFSAVGRAFASELMHLEAESWFTRLGDLAPALVRFGEAFDEMQSYQDAVLMSLEATFLAPMREFVKRELKEVRDLKDAVHKAHEDYLQQLGRYLLLKRGTDPAVVAARTQELVAVRRRFELGRYDLVTTLNQLETKKKFALVERVVSALYACLGYFHQGHSELAALEPGMRELQHQLRLSRRAFAQQARIAEAKRMQLEVLLSTAKPTNIQGIKAQLALDDWSSLFDETAAAAAASPVPPPSQPEQQEERGTRGDGTSRASSVSSAGGGGGAGAPHSPLSLHRSRHSSSASSLLSISLPPPSLAASPVPPSSPPLLAMAGGGGGRPTSQSWSQASFSSSLAMSPSLHNNGHSGRPRAGTAETGQPQQYQEPAPVSAICESGMGGPKDGGRRSLLLPSLPSSSPGGRTPAAGTRTPAASSSGACVKQGYLWKRSSNVRKDWKRRFFFIRNGKLSYQREGDPVGPPRADICDLLLSTVRECLKDSDAHLTFEILSPGKRPYMLQAENEEEYTEWVLALRSQTEALLGLGGLDTDGGGLGLSPPTSPGRHHRHEGTTHAAFVERVRRANPCCADCGAPGIADWAVTTAGVAICIQCSGIHRSLGVHVSRVRSLVLDRWPRALRLVMEGVGNARFNAIWEAALPSEGPGPTASREAREGFIRDKYVGRAFVAQGERAGEEGEEDPDVILYNAARRGDVTGLLWALAHGADVGYANPKQRGRTPVHAVCEGAAAAAAAATAAGVGGGGGGMQGRLVCLELLHQNGAALDALDEDELSALDVAMTAPSSSSAGGSRPTLTGEKGGSALEAHHISWQQNQLSVGASCSSMSLVSYLLSKLEKRAV